MSSSNLPSWRALAAHQREISAVHMREMFAADPGRAGTFTLSLEDLVVDYSKNRISRETMRLLAALARESRLEE
jgi:glucose-6-phosphate isomerase